VSAEETWNEETAEDWVEEFQEEKELPNERDLDEAATRQLTAQVVKSLNGDPKMRQSEFVNFIAKMSTGEIEFDSENGVVIDNGGPKALPGAVHPRELEGGDWAAEFASRTDQDAVDQWADEYAHEQWKQPGYDGQIGQMGQGMGQMGQGMGQMGQMPGMAQPGQAFQESFATPGAQFAEAQEALAKEALQGPQEDWADEFTDGDALGLNPNPLTGEATLKHKFTLPNPYGEEDSPYDRGMELYKKGDFGNAILAFEAELQRNGDNPDAKFQLASAIILSRV